jgi:hypothetical protein
LALVNIFDHLCYTALFYHERVFYVKTQLCQAALKNGRFFAQGGMAASL